MNMMELTTSAVFLMSSLYGAGNSGTQVAMANAAVTAASQAPVTQISTSTDPKAIEAYVRSQVSDEPILVDIARCESTFRQFNPDGTVVRGRW